MLDELAAALESAKVCFSTGKFLDLMTAARMGVDWQNLVVASQAADVLDGAEFHGEQLSIGVCRARSIPPAEHIQAHYGDESRCPRRRESDKRLVTHNTVPSDQVDSREATWGSARGGHGKNELVRAW